MTTRGLNVCVRFRPIPGIDTSSAPIGSAAHRELLLASQEASKWQYDRTSVTAINRDAPASSQGLSSPPQSRRTSRVGLDGPGQSPQKNGKEVTGTKFDFNRVFLPSEGTADVFREMALPIVDDFCKGFNGCMFAFGQTNSGKSYTISGETGQSPGLLPLSVERIFGNLACADDGSVSMAKISFLEVHNEVVRDLLSEVDERDLGRSSSHAPLTLNIMDGPQGHTVVNGLSEYIVGSLAEVLTLIAHGELRRSIGQNSAHAHASRSHTVFQMTLETRQQNERAVQQSVLHIVDLAGSEATYAPTDEELKEAFAARQALKMIGNTEEKQRDNEKKIRNREGANIRKSLHSLVRCVQLLAEGKGTSFIPYRDSKLTRLLRTGLAGNCHTAVVCTVNPSEDKETLATLRFASNAQKVQGTAKTVTVLDDQDAMLGRYERELRSMQMQMDLNSENTAAQLQHVTGEKDRYASQLEKEAAERKRLETRCANLNRLFMTSKKIQEDEEKSRAEVAAITGGNTTESERIGRAAEQNQAPKRRARSGPNHRCPESKSFFLTVAEAAACRVVKGGEVVVASSIGDQVAKDIMKAQAEEIRNLKRQTTEQASAEIKRLEDIIAELEATKAAAEQQVAALKKTAMANGKKYEQERSALEAMPSPTCGAKRVRRPAPLSDTDFAAKYPSLCVE